MKEPSDILVSFRNAVDNWPTNTALHIRKENHTYQELAERISAIRKLIRQHYKKGSQHIVGVAAWDHIATYAAVYAIWYEGHVFLPLSPRNPASRNNEIVKQAGCTLVLSAEHIPQEMLHSSGVEVIDSADSRTTKTDLTPARNDADDFLYLLFTSGSTGVPKGVKLSRKNFNQFIFSFIQLGYQFTPEDRFLQIYDLTFDASLHCYVVPLSLGASVYTVPWNEVKYMYALRLLRDHELTFAKMPPSTISFLRPYFPSIRLEKLRYSLFGGEALVAELASEWAACVPNAKIQNVYGPTEVTINCLVYPFNPQNGHSKEYNGVVSIGKTFGDNHAIIVGESGELLAAGKKGELCIAGSQVTPGYWNDEKRDALAFFTRKSGNKTLRYYRTGDLAFMDKDGDIMYCGRIDNQVQIQGFRVELGDVESCARSLVKGDVAAIARKNFLGTLQIFLFTQKNVNKEKLLEGLKKKLPDYMVPSDIIPLDAFPLNVSGKIDRKAMEEIIA